MLPDMPKSKQALFSSFPFLLHLMLLDKYAGVFVQRACVFVL